MITEAIVLAGGLGTRLQAAVPDLPKCLAPVAGKPFLSYLLNYFQQQGIRRFVFALGYRADQVQAFAEGFLPEDDAVFSTESSPLGTGGGIYKACALTQAPDVLVLNADSFFGISLAAFSAFHKDKDAACSLSLKDMKNFSRYGVVETGPSGLVTAFKEKQAVAEGTINGGVYALKTAPFLARAFPELFSFEKDYLEPGIAEKSFYGLRSAGYFIDIGVPEDYERAGNELLQALA